jgi:1-acyl-sn-glycerol-3-phosphate acyltransferase
LFFRFELVSDSSRALELKGPVVFVGNHPNGLIDPGLFFILARRKITFLAKAPLFSMPVLGWILKGMDALPVFRKQDGPGDTSKNEGTLAASADALVEGRAITIFPEGKSHSEPQLAELKTGCARIALDAARRGAEVMIVPVGLTYEAKNLYRSRVHAETGAPIAVRPFIEQPGEDPHEAAKRLTSAIADALTAVTLNLEAWEDLPIVETAEALYALNQTDEAGQAERKKAFARGMALLREEQPVRFHRVKAELAAFRRRLELVRVAPDELTNRYRLGTVTWFIVRNLMWLLGLPIFLLGLVLFTVPYFIPKALVKVTKPEDDTESTVKVLTLFLLAPFWWALLTALAFFAGGAIAAVATFVAVPPLALFTQYYFERRSAALHDARVFFLLGSRATFKARLLEDGTALARELEQLATELGPRVRG